MPHHQIADDASARRPAKIAGQTERPTWARTLRRRFDDADEPFAEHARLRIASDDEESVFIGMRGGVQHARRLGANG